VLISLWAQWNAPHHKMSMFNLLYNFILLFITTISELIQTATKSLTSYSLVILSFLTGEKNVSRRILWKLYPPFSSCWNLYYFFSLLLRPILQNNIPLPYCWETHLQNIIVSSVSWLTQFALATQTDSKKSTVTTEDRLESGIPMEALSL